MIKNRILSIKSNTDPLTSSFTTKKDNSHIVIGNIQSRVTEKIFYGENYPKIITIFCKLVPKREFDKSIFVIGKFEEYMKTRTEHTMKFNLYDESEIPLSNFISGFNIEFEYFDPEQLVKNEIPEAWQSFLAEYNSIYKHEFLIQTKSGKLKMLEINHKFASKLHPFAGYWGKNGSLCDIQQHFFFISNKNDTDGFIRIVSPNDIVNSKIDEAASTSIKSDSIQSLNDLIISENIEISFPDEVGLITKYKSASVKKDTFVSAVFCICFKKVLN